MKSTFRALSLGAAVSTALLVAAPAEARIMIDALGGEVKLEGSLSSEARARFNDGPTYLNQWIQKFELNAEVNYKDVGIFDTLSFVTVIRPEFDAAYYWADTFGAPGNGAKTKSYLGTDYNYQSDPIGYGGFDVYGAFINGGNFTGENTLNTGGLSKNVTEGVWTPEFLRDNFESILNRTPAGNKFRADTAIFGGRPGEMGGPNTGFPVLSTLGQQGLTCHRCTNLDNDPLNVAMNNTDSMHLYPFRELYIDATAGDWWVRVGKQQVVWGKTDFFRLQDLVNPVDFGQHFFFDSFEDIRIPQWILSIQRKFGDWGPTTDNALTILWNFDEFMGIGLGNPNQGWAHPFAKEKSTFAGFNTYFSVEPCVGFATAQANGMPLNDVCGQNPRTGGRKYNDNRLPSGFGQPVGLSYEARPEWEIENTEPGARWEFRIGEFHVAISEFYGWNDVPVFRFHSVNVPNALLGLDAPSLVNPADPNGPLRSAATYNDPVTDKRLGTQDWLVFDLVCARNAGAPGCGTPRTNSLTPNQTGATPASVANLFGGFSGFTDASNPIPAVLSVPGAGGLSPNGSVTNAAVTNQNLGHIPVRVMNPEEALRAFARGGNPAALKALGGKATGPVINAFDFWRTGLVLGGQTDIQYKQASTTGLSFDYFEPWSGVVFRVESSFTVDELVNNTRTADWTDTSTVMRWSIGLDRPTWIKWLNKDRTFFLSMQIFDTWYWDHEGDKHNGYFTDEHNFITTFFYIANYMRDTLKPVGFVVWEEASNSWVAGQSVEWLIDNHWSVKGGFNIIWGGNNNFRHDAGPFSSFVVPTTTFGGSPYNQSVFGVAHEGIGALRDNDELFFQVKYQF